VLTGLAFTAAGVLVYALESSHIESEVRDQIEQEIAEFSELQAATTRRPRSRSPVSRP